MGDAYILDGVRTPRGRGKATGSLHGIHPQHLLAQVLDTLVERGLDPHVVDEVVVGNSSNQGDHGHSIGRLAVLAANWPYTTPGYTLNRYCGSALQAVAVASMGVRSGEQDLVVAGGVESMSRWPAPAGSGAIDGANPALHDKYPLVPQGISADLIATQRGYTREQLDGWAVMSQQRAATALREDRFARSIVPVRDDSGAIVLRADEFVREGTTREGLAALRPSFEALGARVPPGRTTSFDEAALSAYPEVGAVRHLHHAGNSSGVVDGAAALVVAGEDHVRDNGLTPRARIVSSATVGCDPVIMLSAPAPAARKALRKAGMSIKDIDLWEINEAFAAVALETSELLGLDPGVVNVNGGAIALGHPIGATGVMLVQTVLDELERTDRTTGLVTMCTGGGMAVATVIERV
ncbi:acetyl-CoA C-acetyltransferase [Micromonospora sp. HUAS LYJ1]|uniref:acetyl-CoA C-acetyltransferase n=1 Tax=Micromonospora sp. HUAS LYJ1 TaxID=3061626 RepID=UPI002670E355|nr:acetyl-CoA C-acetyltransferase [Micromonospora sp. HUAS LYJ1]WKU03545.1 acetyl-CoA C-acetyltransferase [Micromonospora sp. HUAS LYJ1]